MERKHRSRGKPRLDPGDLQRYQQIDQLANGWSLLFDITFLPPRAPGRKLASLKRSLRVNRRADFCGVALG